MNLNQLNDDGANTEYKELKVIKPQKENYQKQQICLGKLCKKEVDNLL